MGKKPNIIFITTDEHRMDFLELFGAQNVKTPNIKYLSKTGASFKNMYTVSPLCLASRSSIVSGLYPHNHTCVTNADQLDPNYNLLFNALKQNNYYIRISGKLHFMHTYPWNNEKGPNPPKYNRHRLYSEYGIDELYLCEGKLSSIGHLDDYSSELYSENVETAKSYRKTIAGAPNKLHKWAYKKEWHPDYRVATKAIDIIDRWEKEKNEFLWLSFPGPHYPFDPPQEYIDMILPDTDYSDIKLHCESQNIFKGGEIPLTTDFSPDVKQKMCCYYAANIAMIDECIGKVIKKLDKKNELDNTIIIFTCDHGEALGDRYMAGKEKLFYESVVKVPFIIRFPDKIKKGYISEKYTQNIDITPTILDILDIKYDKHIFMPDGISLKEELTNNLVNNKNEIIDRQYVISEQHGNIMIRTKEGYKYIRHSEQTDELFDLNKDPNELKNLINEDEYKDILHVLKSYLLDYFITTSLKNRSLFPLEKVHKKSWLTFYGTYSVE